MTDEKLLIVSPIYPFPSVLANQKDITSRLPFFQKRFSKVFMAVFSNNIDELKSKVDVCADSNINNLEFILLKREKKGLFSSEYSFSETVSVLAEVINSNNIKYVWLEYNKLSVLIPELKKRCLNTVFIIRVHNFETLHYLEKEWVNLLAFKRNLFSLLKGLFRIIIEDFISIVYADKLAFISYEDMSIHKLFRKKMYYLPYVHNEKYASHIPKKDLDVLNLFYMGSDFNNTVNMSGLNYIVEKVLPFIESISVKVKINILGKNIPQHIIDKKSEYFNPVGFVDDLNKFLENMDVSFLPVKYGFGMKIKTYESLARGFPTLGFSRAFRGFSVKNRKNAVIFNNIDQLNDGIVFLSEYGNRKNISENAVNLIQNNFNHDELVRLFS